MCIDPPANTRREESKRSSLENLDRSYNRDTTIGGNDSQDQSSNKGTNRMTNGERVNSEGNDVMVFTLGRQT